MSEERGTLAISVGRGGHMVDLHIRTYRDSEARRHALTCSCGWAWWSDDPEADVAQALQDHLRDVKAIP